MPGQTIGISGDQSGDGRLADEQCRKNRSNIKSAIAHCTNRTMGVLIGTIVNVLLVGVGGAVLCRSVVDSPMMPLLLNEREQKEAKQ